MFFFCKYGLKDKNVVLMCVDIKSPFTLVATDIELNTTCFFCKFSFWVLYLIDCVIFFREQLFPHLMLHHVDKIFRVVLARTELKCFCPFCLQHWLPRSFYCFSTSGRLRRSFGFVRRSVRNDRSFETVIRIILYF